MREDRFGARHDYETELIENAKHKKHFEGDCEGAPVCLDCLLDQERAKESKGG